MGVTRSYSSFLNTARVKRARIVRSGCTPRLQCPPGSKLNLYKVFRFIQVTGGDVADLVTVVDVLGSGWKEGAVGLDRRGTTIRVTLVVIARE